MKINYEIRFLDYWHIGSGQSAGALSDAVVLRDVDGLPYVPGKTIKGLVREIADRMEDKDFIKNVLGEKGESYRQIDAYFSNAILKEKEALKKDGLFRYLFDTITFTAIDEHGLAKQKSLRDIEFVIPVELEGFVECPPEYVEKMKKYLRAIKRMGYMRNRGFGRCTITCKDGA